MCVVLTLRICSIPRTDVLFVESHDFALSPGSPPSSSHPITSHHITSQASNERINYLHFANALRKGYVPLSEETLYDEEIVKWAYNVALTRFHEVWEPSRQKLIAPMADMVS